jgi:hypothetical protein
MNLTNSPTRSRVLTCFCFLKTLSHQESILHTMFFVDFRISLRSETSCAETWFPRVSILYTLLWWLRFRGYLSIFWKPSWRPHPIECTITARTWATVHQPCPRRPPLKFLRDLAKRLNFQGRGLEFSTPRQLLELICMCV